MCFACRAVVERMPGITINSLLSRTLEGVIEEGAYLRRELNKVLKYEQIFYGYTICIFQESSSITL